VIVATTAEGAGEEPVLDTTEPKTLVLPGESDTFSGSRPAPGPAEISRIAELPKNCDPENTPALRPPEESAFTPFPRQSTAVPVTQGEIVRSQIGKSHTLRE